MKRSIILDPPEAVWDVTQLDQLIALWLDQCAGALPKPTVRSYQVQIAHFRRWLATNGPGLNWELRKADMQRFMTELEAGPAYNTRKGVVKRLRMCLRWANETGRTEGVDYSAWVARPKGSKPVRVAAQIPDLVALMVAADLSPYPTRNRAILAVMLGAGLRRGECAGLNVEDVAIYADGSGTIVVRDAKIVEGRDQQWRVVAFDAPTGRYIRAWIEELGRTSGPLWPSMRFRRDRLSSVGIYEVVKKLIADAHLSSKLQGPHDLRRNFTTYFARQRRGEINGQLLSRQLGHSSFAMTATYNLQDAEDLRLAAASPFALMG